VWTDDEPSAPDEPRTREASSADRAPNTDDAPNADESPDSDDTSNGDDAPNADESSVGDEPSNAADARSPARPSPQADRFDNESVEKGSVLDRSDGFEEGNDPDSGDSTAGVGADSNSDGSPFGSLPENLPVSGPIGVAVGVGLLVGLLARQLSGPATVGPIPTAAQARGLVASLRAHLRFRLDCLQRFVPFPGYSRYDDSDPLENETRANVFETIENAPGAHLSQVSDDADVARSTVRYHVRVLDEEGLVSSAKVAGKRRFYPARTEGVELAAAIEDDATAAVLNAIRRLELASGSALADELDRDPSTVSHHLSRLEDAGLVERERDGSAVVNSLAPATAAALERVEAMPADAARAQAD